MSRKLLPVLLVIFVVGAAIGVRMLLEDELSNLPTPESQTEIKPASIVPARAANAEGAETETRPEPAKPVGHANDDTAEEDTGNDIVAFRSGASGELVLDERTRLNIEALIASNASNELRSAVQEQTESLPPAAARQAEELVDKFISYQQLQRQTYPPGNAPLSEDDAVRELEGLHALRVTYFGPDVARRLYGKEESIAREMIELMRIENDQSLTTQEKLERAQTLRNQLPGVAAMEKRNRESAAQNEPDEK
jgi:hypothetical protein